MKVKDLDFNEEGLLQENGRTIEDGQYTLEDGTEIWVQNGGYHREDGPAIMWDNGSNAYWLNDIPYPQIQNDVLWRIEVHRLKRKQKEK